MGEYGRKCEEELNKIVGLVRGQLTSLERATCGALVTIDVHARDVTLQMAKEGVEDVREFKWESQLRFVKLNCLNIKKTNGRKLQLQLFPPGTIGSSVSSNHLEHIPRKQSLFA